MKAPSLVVVGVGLKLISHLTEEAKAHIQQADKLLYLVNEPLMKKWLQSLNVDTESLDDIYLQYKLRSDAYAAISDYILSVVKSGQNVCVVLYGHPTIFAMPALDAVLKAKKEGVDAKILPGIATDACLFADLGINPGEIGWLSLEATDLLIHRRKLDPSYHVLIWQVSVIGMQNHERNHENKKGQSILHNYLSEYYKESHRMIAYSAAQYPSMDPQIKIYALHELPHVEFSRTSTLYLPPSTQPACDHNMIRELGMSR